MDPDAVDPTKPFPGEGVGSPPESVSGGVRRVCRGLLFGPQPKPLPRAGGAGCSFLVWGLHWWF